MNNSVRVIISWDPYVTETICYIYITHCEYSTKSVKSEVSYESYDMTTFNKKLSTQM